MEMISNTEWGIRLTDPTLRREQKPRTSGCTMVLDKGLGLKSFEDMLEVASEYIDVIKLGFGTSSLYPKQILERKISLAKQYHVDIIPGGTFLEVAIVQGEIANYFKMVNLLGFSGIEVSDGTIEMSRILRNELIKTAIDQGLTVFTEYGKKVKGSRLKLEELLTTVHLDLNLGARWVTMEARESGTDTGLFNERGEPEVEALKQFMRQFSNLNQILWEAPLKSQQVFFLNTIGKDVNLGNIAPQDILSLEALRRGLRSDTMEKHPL